ncbi:unnamed protein product, partial [Prorocentrum cordatum]
CFVDDPIFALAGRAEVRDVHLALVLMLWAALYFEFSWAKASRGSEAGHVVGVTVAVSPDKVAKVGRALGELAADAFCDRKAVEEFDGLCSWVGSIAPAVRPLARMVWAAACAPPSGRKTAGRVAKARIKLVIIWVRALLDDAVLAISRTFWVGGAGEGPMSFLETGDASAAAVCYSVTNWTLEDATAPQAKWLDPAAQPMWEACASLIAVHAWRGWLGGRRGRLRLRGDAKGVLQAVVRRRGRHAALNRIVAELLLTLGRAMRDIE